MRETNEKGQPLYDSEEIVTPELELMLSAGFIAIRFEKPPHRTENNNPICTGGGHIIPSYIHKDAVVRVKGGAGKEDTIGVIISVGEGIALVQDGQSKPPQIWREWGILEAI